MTEIFAGARSFTGIQVDEEFFPVFWRKLVRLSEHGLRVAYCHYAVYPIASESNPALVAFRDWLVEEARRT